MESKMFALGLFMLLCVVQQKSSALKCYTYNALTLPQCDDMKDKGLQAQNCTVESVLSQGQNFYSQFGLSGANNVNPNRNKKKLVPFCLKTVFNNGTVSIVDRRCAVKFQDQDPCELSLTSALQTVFHSPIEFCGACETDGCNSGNSMQLFSSLIVFGAMVCTARLFV